MGRDSLQDRLVKIDDVVLELLPGPNRIGYSKTTVSIHESLDHRFSDSSKPRPRLRPAAAHRSSAASLHHPPQHPWRRYPTRTKITRHFGGQIHSAATGARKWLLLPGENDAGWTVA